MGLQSIRNIYVLIYHWALQDLCPPPLVAVPYVMTQRYSSSRTYVIKMTSSVNDAWSPVVTEELTFDELPVSNRAYLNHDRELNH